MIICVPVEYLYEREISCANNVRHTYLPNGKLKQILPYVYNYAYTDKETRRTAKYS